ncbi:Hsp70 family protein [Gloeobacter morelensis]|uniref:Hsp70 family protein n=1 Tax=Gloeobacter morelensis MG652769 TaxID=2781736 RepID=A0ABY3PPB6_9CYAN|nr:Hsp70 family protein [Gloeobacter morelensis]UFP95521.1 Hsp70 family protein [Gloeobacter morelensis MG652769]
MYSFDFGTSNTVVARWNRALAQPETLAVRSLSQVESPPLVPSVLYVQDAGADRVLAGQEVLARGLDNSGDPRFFSNFKRGIGSAVQGFTPALDGVEVGFERVGLWFIRRLIAALRDQGESPDDVVFTVPVNSFELYRQWLLAGCSELEAARIQLLDESTAAALGYGLENGQTVLVIDFGGGTLDLSLVQPAVPEQSPDGFLLKWGRKLFAGKDSAPRTPTARVLAKVGRNLGGMDIDTWLADSLARQQKLPKGALLQRVAERLKIRLSSETAATEVFFDEDSLRTCKLTLEREQFEALLAARGFIAQLDESLGKLLQQARQRNLDPEAIDAVILVGGTCQIPAVQNWVVDRFGPAKVRKDKVFEAVAHGALRLGQGLQVEDFLYHAYGVRYWDHRKSRHGWHALFKAGQAYPTTNPVELVLGASVSNQPVIELVVGEMGDGEDTEVFFEDGRLTIRTSASEQTVRSLNDTDEGRVVARLEPPGFPGRDRVKVQLRVDARRQLRITVEDLQTQQMLLQDQAVIELR